MERLARLLEAVRVISPHGEFRLKGVPEQDGACQGTVVVGGVVLVESPIGTPEEVVHSVTRKLEGMSQRMRATLAPPPPDDE